VYNRQLKARNGRIESVALAMVLKFYFDCGCVWKYNPLFTFNRLCLMELTPMYAVIQTGGKQYRVAEGTTLKIEKLELGAGDSVEFDKVLMVQSGDSVKVGQPFVEGGKVTATVVSQGRHKKVRIIKFRRRKHHMKQQGHRQYYTEVQITGISA